MIPQNCAVIACAETHKSDTGFCYKHGHLIDSLVHVRPQVRKIKPRLNEEKSEHELDDEKVEYYETNAGCSV